MLRLRAFLATAIAAAVIVPGTASARDFASTALDIVPSGEPGSFPVPAGLESDFVD